jgi:predicted O-methyltransferase YrrM
MKDVFMDDLKQYFDSKLQDTTNKLKESFANFFGNDKEIKVKVIKSDPKSSLGKMFSAATYDLGDISFSYKIERRASITERLGKRPLWDGYTRLSNYPTKITKGALRSSSEVRTISKLGRLFTRLVIEQKPEIIVEFGTAFGISGMYWLAGLEKIKSGKLLTFEVNHEWAKIANVNLKSISDKFVLTNGPFEDKIEGVLEKKQKIDMAFIDAIHTDDFVTRQLKIVMEHLSKEGIVVFDDIDFSEDMKNCWKKICADKRFITCIEIQGIGIVQSR